jgi:glucose-6-phosphate isomerase
MTPTSQEFWALFPMWDLIEGRISETSVVGLLPASLEGSDIDEILRGTRGDDDAAHVSDVKVNPVLRLSLMWPYNGNVTVVKELVILIGEAEIVTISKARPEYSMNPHRKLRKSGIPNPFKAVQPIS